MSSYKNQAIIPPFQSRVALARTSKNLQNRQNSAVSLAPRYTSLYLINKDFKSKKHRYSTNSYIKVLNAII